ncbi:MAG: WYL domain-containing protein [Alphaproteobacteria bacterium]|jgi:predicted DNA-binding transcriptional regulator YafY|nr:WYL domain-containing protein [Alphaproteobacteria bacterium]MBU2041958.1 WYL domain-containing protein [Alphaproteobacteria bacterium]MBU2125112.1 WYL domain-containing protein [Alphaproteobacteria bacterium]MBU2207200.1 WYL domain-containing protein [Alphaproteobacteria bacterium]MBU2291418.1 WYL domain-containing protein [Alphaproteobacteria bacterium]
MRHDKAAVVIELARRMAASAEGLTLDEMARDAGVGRRTAERMRDAVLALYPAAEEVSDPPTKRWRIRGGLSAFEQAPTTGELVELSKAALGLRASGEPGRAAALEGLERKLKSAMRSTTLNRLAPDLEALVRAETIAVQAGPRPSADEAVLAEIRQAILAGQPLGFIYSRPGVEARRRSMAPCGVMFGRANYLVAADRESGRVQTFRLDRMSAVRAEDGVAAPPADFDLQSFASQSFGIYQDEIEDVVLRVTPEGANEARAWRWHPTQTLEDLPDGSVRVRFTASGMRELAWHLFTWGHQVRILAPDRLKTAMAEALDAAKEALNPTEA